MKKRLVDRLEQYGLSKTEATPSAEEARKLIITERPTSIRKAIKMVGYNVCQRIYAFNRYYSHMQSLCYGARDFDSKYFAEKKKQNERLNAILNKNGFGFSDDCSCNIKSVATGVSVGSLESKTELVQIWHEGGLYNLQDIGEQVRLRELLASNGLPYRENYDRRSLAKGMRKYASALVSLARKVVGDKKK